MLNVAIPAAVVAAGLGMALFLALYLFCTLKAEIRAAARRTPAAADELGDWQRRLEQIEGRSAPVPAESPVAGDAELPAVVVRPGMNLSRRSQALRLARRGGTPEQIAARLGLATGEVRLLLKIHGMLIEQAVAGPRRSEPLNSSPESADTPSSAPRAFPRVVQPSVVQPK